MRYFLCYFRNLGVEAKGIPRAHGGPKVRKDPYPMALEKTPRHMGYERSAMAEGQE